MMIKRTIVLPIRDNQGISLAAELAECERELLAAAGGFTRAATVGAWIAPAGRIYRDRGRTYSVVLEPAADVELVAMLPAWCARLRQESLYTDTAAVTVAFVAPQS